MDNAILLSCSSGIKTLYTTVNSKNKITVKDSAKTPIGFYTKAERIYF